MSFQKTAIVILNWNGEELLSRFLPSVVEHSQIEGVEVIVADNGSTDQSISFIETNFATIKVLPLGENHGFAKGYNEALKKIDADNYILLNSDVEVTSGWVQPMIDLLNENEEVAAVQPKILSWNEKDTFEYAGAAGGFIDRLGFPFCRGRILNVMEKDEGQYDQVTSVFWASGACMAVRASLFHKAGGFDSDFWAHMEEIDLCWRLKNMGYQVQFTPFSKVYHLGGASLSYGNPKKLYLNFRNSLWLLYKNLPRRKFYQVLLVRMVMDGMAAFKLLSELNYKGFWSVPKAHFSFYKGFSSIKRKRKQLKKIAKPGWHDEIFCKSIIWKFYIKNQDTYREVDC